MTYPATTLTQQKGKWYVQCTIPKELRPAFKDRKQKRLSTGTADHTLAGRKQHELSAAIYAEFDQAQSDYINRKAADKLEPLLVKDHEIQELMERELFRRMDLAYKGTESALYSEVAKKHLETHDWNRIATRRAFKLASEQFVLFTGDLPITEIKNSHAYE
ncbi:MAG: hypothetical protein KJO78_04435, partial [Alphaproteobacteria bacterium]|nr:hypothetical protein [Alphaproteobacteria bacterium]